MSTMMRLAGAFLLASLGVAIEAEAQMPNLGAMSGTPLPAGDLPNGTVSVRVVRGDLTNNVPGLAVELHGAPGALEVKTDDSGRAVFSDVPAGANVHASTVLDGKPLESQSFPMPAAGGVKIMLVGGAAAGGAAPAGASPAAPTAPVAAGKVVLGGQSRFVVEVTDEGLDVYNLLDIVNATQAPVATEPLVFAVPDGAQGMTVLEGSAQQARVDGHGFRVVGPFAPGVTAVQMAYRLPYSTGAVSFEQGLPAELTTTSIVVRKLGQVTFRSPQAASARETSMDGGSVYIMASGQGLPAGGRVQFQLEGLPHHSSVPRFVALGLAVFVIGLGAWLASNGPDPKLAEARHKAAEKRDALMDDLVELERQHAAGSLEGQKYATRREVLMSQLERVYAQLDRETVAVPRDASDAARPSRTASAHAAR
jgi:hypothetical protein